ncbi:MAG: LacI family transcriptional regulator [Sphingobacteriales bacterium]|nr:LacI family transcriptional regulator [Sphingobacteriales bacterium]
MADITLKKLAELLNLSISTISRSLNDDYQINQTTKDKVIALAKELNYQPNPYAGSLRKKGSKTIAVILPEVANNFFSLAIDGIEEVAQKNGFHVLIYLTHENYLKEVDIANHLMNGRVDGILMSLSSETNNLEHLDKLIEKGIPLVLFDRVSDKINSPHVTTDDFEVSQKATEHLITAGSKKIAFLSLSRYLSIAEKRFKGYSSALKKHDLDLDEKLIVSLTNSLEENYENIKKLIIEEKPDAIFASVESLAMTVYEVVNDLKLKIPNDIKVLSFSNLRIASFLAPSLTSINQPAFEIGRQATSILTRAIKYGKFETPLEKIILKSELQIRNSTV